MTSADLLLHPVRLRIVQAFLGDRALTTGDLRAHTLEMLFNVSEGEAGLAKAVEKLCQDAASAVENGASILVLSDRGVDHARFDRALDHEALNAGHRVISNASLSTVRRRSASRLISASARSR